LKKTGVEYREHVKRVVSQDIVGASKFPVSPEVIYGLELTLCFPNILNKPGSKWRYKTIDVDNRIKFLQDALTTALGIPNDSQIFENVARKVLGKVASVAVRVYVLDPKEFLGG
jgi:Holliday junction resolvase RusA-like endonuclease